MKKLCLLAAALSLAAVAQDPKPNFSGTWEMAADKCDFGTPLTEGPRFPGRIDSRTDVIDHREPLVKFTIKSRTDHGELTQERSYRTDGQETTDQIGEAVTKTKARWEGKELVAETVIETDHGPAHILARWRLADDGRTLITERTMKAPAGETKQKLVFVKKS